MWLTSARPVLTWESFIASRTACMKYLREIIIVSGIADDASYNLWMTSRLHSTMLYQPHCLAP